MKHPDHEEWMRDIHDRQRNVVFPDTARNFGGFWGGLYRQTLTPFQTVGFIVLIVFYILFAISVVAMTWPRGAGSVAGKIIHGYWLNFLLCIPLLLYFLALRATFRQRKHGTGPGSTRQPPPS